jgi:hypothetical protein
VNQIAVRRTVAVLLSGFGLVVPSGGRAVADPVPLAKPRKPAVSLAAVREAAAIEGTVRAAPEITPPELFNSGLPVITRFPNESAPRSFPAFEPFPARANDRAMASTAFDPFGGSPGRGIDPRGPQPNPGGVRGLWNGITKWTGERAKALTDAVAGPETQPDARVGQPMPAGVMNPNWNAPPNGPPQARLPMQPFRGTTPGGRAAYAGNPAYRWYGWGTTTPGANPYAPGGEYPATSSQWYTMSGATPGAFPVPVTNPFRPAPGVGAPAYAVNTTSAPVPSVAPPSLTTTAAPFVPEGPKPIVESAPFRYVPPDELPVSTGPVPSVPSAGNWRGGAVPMPPKAEEFPVRPATAEPAWQPIQNAAPAKGPTLFIGQSPAKPAAQADILQAVAFEPVAQVSLMDRIRAVAGAEVRNLEAKKLGRDGVIVRFDAPTDAVAEAAAKAIAAIADLKAYTVTFDVVVGK